jgi:DNA (cytosine-5)-methyltransferase 1
VGCRAGLDGFRWPAPSEQPKLSIRSVLERRPKNAKRLPQHFRKYLKAWQEFVCRFPNREELPSFPIWAMEFGATYPYEKKSPRWTGVGRLGSFKGSFGVSLRDLGRDEVLAALPPYARYRCKSFPKWKIDFIRQNRELYKRHRKWLSNWLPSILKFAPSFQKFEWNCKGEGARTAMATAMIAFTSYSAIRRLSFQLRSKCRLDPPKCSRILTERSLP